MKLTDEFKVGLMTIAAFVVLMISVLFVNNFKFGSGGNTVTVLFNFLGDLKSDAPVKVAGGINVGRVKNIRYENGKAVVDVLITDKGLKLRKDSKFAIYSTSLLGTKYLQINANLGVGEELKPGDVLEGTDSNNLDKTFTQLGDVLETFEGMMGDPKSKENFAKSFDNMNRTTESLLELTNASRVKIEKILEDLAKSSGDVGKIVASVQSVSKSLETLSSALTKKDLSEAVKNFNITMKNMSQLSADLNSGKGAVGVLLKDEKTADNVKGLVEELKAHPWKLLWKK
jgi:phospholipid/cholesterol/gamma-HCH transport system substrate-binding protein